MATSSFLSDQLWQIFLFFFKFGFSKSSIHNCNYFFLSPWEAVLDTSFLVEALIVALAAFVATFSIAPTVMATYSLEVAVIATSSCSKDGGYLLSCINIGGYVLSREKSHCYFFFPGSICCYLLSCDSSQ